MGAILGARGAGVVGDGSASPAVALAGAGLRHARPVPRRRLAARRGGRSPSSALRMVNSAGGVVSAPRRGSPCWTVGAVLLYLRPDRLRQLAGQVRLGVTEALPRDRHHASGESIRRGNHGSGRRRRGVRRSPTHGSAPADSSLRYGFMLHSDRGLGLDSPSQLRRDERPRRRRRRVAVRRPGDGRSERGRPRWTRATSVAVSASPVSAGARSTLRIRSVARRQRLFSDGNGPYHVTGRRRAARQRWGAGHIRPRPARPVNRRPRGDVGRQLRQPDRRREGAVVGTGIRRAPRLGRRLPCRTTGPAQFERRPLATPASRVRAQARRGRCRDSSGRGGPRSTGVSDSSEALPRLREQWVSAGASARWPSEAKR